MEDKKQNGQEQSDQSGGQIQAQQQQQQERKQGEIVAKGIIGPPLKRYDPIVIPTPEQIVQQDISSSCLAKSVISLIGGGLMGAMFGLVFGSFENAHPGEPPPQNQKVMEVVRESLKLYRLRMWSYGKTFAGIGFLFAGSECLIEYYRAKHDWGNSAGAGCFTGAAMAYKSGIQGMGFGCAMFGAFSVLIDRYLQHD